jgi:hypothetical protein
VTVVDPRHPLYEQSFPLLHIKNKRELIPSCLVRLAEGAERLIPISVTDLAVLPPVVFPLPVDISSLHNLAQVYVRIRAQIGKECEDGATGNSQFDRSTISAPECLGNIDSSPAKGSAANDGVDLSPDRRAVDGGGGG